MILKEQSFKIKKIKETSKDWLLYPEGSNKPFKLPKEQVYGNLPPVWKFPWLSHTLNIKTAANFVAYAEMDGLVLFNIPEEQYPERVKKEVARIRKIDEDYAQMQKEYQDSLKTQLAEYLPQVPEVKELEDSFAGLPVCWRMYLKMRLPMLYQNDDSRQRLTLMYRLITIANRLYKRHVDTEATFGITWAEVDFKVRNLTIFDLTDILVTTIEANPEYRDSRAFAIYFEVRDELRRVLPQAPLRLEICLVQTICRLLEDYATDMSLLDRRRSYTVFGETMTSDGEAYGRLKNEMKLPKFSSLIIEKEFTDKDIADFNLSC
ncbi:MAG: hypothetical protein IKR92_03420 [Alphaproteobacteria bacterium]|nr:hypothetical protein [Alphaproteobacteria bacterium]